MHGIRWNAEDCLGRVMSTADFCSTRRDYSRQTQRRSTVDAHSFLDHSIQIRQIPDLIENRDLSAFGDRSIELLLQFLDDMRGS
jgi:hypothetical protein